MDEEKVKKLPLALQEKLLRIYEKASHPETEHFKQIISDIKKSGDWMGATEPFASLGKVNPPRSLGEPGGQPRKVELETLEKWVGEEHNLKENGYDYRPSQYEMARMILRGFNEGQPVLVEAPTGTGKGMAYLSAALEWNKATGRRVIITTCTKTLQDQLINQDLPVINSFADKKLNAVVLKGMPNYICLRKLMRLSDREDFTREEAENLLELFISVEDGQGDLDKFGPQPFGEEIRAMAATRLYADCPYYRKCFVSRVYSQASEAEIIIMNHALFLSLCENSDESFPAEEVIIDEAHHLPGVAEDIFGFNVPRWQWPYWRKRLGTRSYFYKKLKQSTALLSEKSTAALKEWKSRLDEISFCWDQMFEFLQSFSRGKWPIKLHHRLDDRKQLGEKVELTVLCEQIAFWTKTLFRLEKELESELPALAGDAGFRREGLAELRRNLVEFFASEPDEQNVRWIEGGNRYSLDLAPLDCSPRLEEILTGICRSPVLTSATLSIDGEFDYLRQKIGLMSGGFQKSLPSPFDFNSQARFYLLKDGPDPRSSDEYHQFLSNAISDICTYHHGRTLVLFTSYRTMDRVLETGKTLIPYPLLVQGGDEARGELLSQMLNDPESVLFGTGTFWEGVDIPGESLEAVVITRLPFPVPNDPMIEARSWKLQEEGKNPFWELMLPEAVLTFRQGIGRLIRTSSDKGSIYCLDSRCAQKSYGQRFMSGLPEGLPAQLITTDWLRQRKKTV